jgi:hypothetical protein
LESIVKPVSLGELFAVVFEATITSQFPSFLSCLPNPSMFLQNVEVSKRFPTQIRQIIVGKICPDIPAH